MNEVCDNGKVAWTVNLESFCVAGAVLGQAFIVSQIVPLLKNVIRSCIDTSSISKPEPVQNWNSLALVDCLFVLGGLIALLQKEVVVKELLEVLVLSYN